MRYSFLLFRSLSGIEIERKREEEEEKGNPVLCILTRFIASLKNVFSTTNNQECQGVKAEDSTPSDFLTLFPFLISNSLNQIEEKTKARVTKFRVSKRNPIAQTIQPDIISKLSRIGEGAEKEKIQYHIEAKQEKIQNLSNLRGKPPPPPRRK